MEKIKYSSHVINRIHAEKWVGGYPNRPHRVMGSQTIWGDIEENPETGAEESFRLDLSKSLWGTIKVALERLVYPPQSAITGYSDFTATQSTIILSDVETNYFIAQIPFINKIVKRRIREQDESARLTQDANLLWP
jgi:hypothetical protein